MASAVVSGRESQLAMMGICGSRKRSPSMAWASPGSASYISDEWNAPLTGSGTALRAPRAEARSTAWATASRSPLMTIWLSVLMLASSTPVSAQICSSASSFSPKMAAIVPGRLREACCISSPRWRTSWMASPKSMTLAATSAVYSPRLWPATQAAAAAPGPAYSCQARQAAMLTVIMAGCELTVSCNSAAGPWKMVLDRGKPRASSASAKVRRAAGDSSQNPAPIPTFCEPCPGKT